MREENAFFQWILRGSFIFIRSAIFLLFFIGNKTVFTQTIINTWEGTSTENVEYSYTLNIDFQGVENAFANVHILQDVTTPTFSQMINSLTFSYSIEPIDTTVMTDNGGNEYMRVEWEIPLDRVKMTLEADITVSTEYGEFISFTHYPVASELVPDSIEQYLQPTQYCQSEATEIVHLADSLVSSCISEADAVIKIINWVRYHMKWICTCSMPFIYSDALNTLQYGGGNCVNFGNLSLALLRAAGIPARKVFGPMIHDWIAYCGHRWVEVYYPGKGWIQYETSYWMPNEGSLPWTFLIPKHIKTYSGSGVGISNGYVIEEHQTTTNINSSPTSIVTSSTSIDTNDFITYYITIRNDHTYDVNTILLSTSVSSEDWQVSLSQDAVYFDPEGPWGETRDIAITIAPPKNISESDSANVIVTATSQYSQSVEQLIYRITPDFSKADEILIQNIPPYFSLMQNYPNPFNSQTIIQYQIKQSGRVSLVIYDMMGRKVRTLVNKNQNTDHYSVTWDATNDQGESLASGVYFCTLNTGNFFERKKIVFLK